MDMIPFLAGGNTKVIASKYQSQEKKYPGRSPFFLC